MQRPKTKFGSIIREARLGEGLTAADVADQIGVRRQTVSYWELGKTEPSERHLPKLAAALGQDYRQLLSILEGENHSVSDDTTADLSKGVIKIAKDISLVEDVLSEEAAIREGGQVIIASLFRAKESEDSAVAETTVANLRREIPYVFALPTIEEFEKNRSVILNYFPKSKHDDVSALLRHCPISSEDLGIVGGDRIATVVSTAAVILDERGVGSPPLRGYQYVEVLDGHAKFFVRITQKTLGELVELIDKHCPRAG